MGKQPDVTVKIEEKRYEGLFTRLERGAGVSEMVVEGELMEGYEP